MNRRIVFRLIGAMAILVLLGSVAPVLAGSEPPIPPTDAEKVIGPTMWAVGVIDASGGTPIATFRIKKVEDCDVATIALNQNSALQSLNNLPDGPEDILYVRIVPNSVFGLDCEGIITKVKNFKTDGQLVSFDAQVQFIAIGDETECTDAVQP